MWLGNQKEKGRYFERKKQGLATPARMPARKIHSGGIRSGGDYTN